MGGTPFRLHTSACFLRREAERRGRQPLPAVEAAASGYAADAVPPFALEAMPGRIRLAATWRPRAPLVMPRTASRAQSSSVPPRSFKGLDKRELAKGVGVFTLLFTIVVGAARHTAATSEEKENSAVMYKRQMQALDAVERSARAFTHPGSDPDALPWDEAKLGQYLRRARLVPSYVGLNGGLDPPSFDGPVSWTSVIMGKNWSSVMVRDKLKRAYSNAKQDMPLFGTGREMSHDDEADELERLQQAQMDDEQYAERESPS